MKMDKILLQLVPDAQQFTLVVLANLKLLGSKPYCITMNISKSYFLSMEKVKSGFILVN